MESGWPVGGSSAPEDSRPSRRLDSWKEIATYFGRDVRTVRRWERSEGLPVHRHLHRSRGSVYAFQQELDRWLEGRSAPVIGSPAAHRWLSPSGLALLAGVSAILGLSAWAPALRDRIAFGSAPRLSKVTTAARAAGPTSAEWSVDPELRQVFLLARHQLQRRVGYREKAREQLERAVERAPNFAEAHALLGEAYVRQALFDPSRRTEAWTRAEESARRALTLDDSLASAHAVLSRVLLLRDWNWTAAAAESLRAMELEPDDPDARSAYALYLRSAGRVAEAIAQREHAQRADPLNPQWLVFLGDEYAFARRFEDAIQAYRKALDLERDFRPAVASLADMCARVDRHAEAAAWQVRWFTLTGRTDLEAAFDEVWQREGPRAALEWLDRRNIIEFRRAPDEHLWDLAYTFARLGDREAALRFLQHANDRREPGVLQARVDPDLDSLRGDRRFDDLLSRVGPRPDDGPAAQLPGLPMRER